MEGKNAQTIANNHNNVVDLEVYLVKGTLDRPWRDPPQWNSQFSIEIKSLISNYEPFEDAQTPVSNILLIGQSGSGKSSFVNTINSIFKGKISSKACTGRRVNNQSLTKDFMRYIIRDSAEKKNLKFRICDTVGIDTNQTSLSKWMNDKDLGYMLDGNLPNQYTVIYALNKQNS
ncbi:interferon-induced protein 44-like [Saccostrea cucullata]|uniref:interferon-induced protein 44-like n=1 Tax=Saccostrea cuccullata TaxID=36930 RepID=UPI002ED43449